jgi:hypothetical protein
LRAFGNRTKLLQISLGLHNLNVLPSICKQVVDRVIEITGKPNLGNGLRISCDVVFMYFTKIRQFTQHLWIGFQPMLTRVFVQC